MCAENDSGQPGCAKNGACNSSLTQFASGDGSWQCYQVPSFLKSLVSETSASSLQIDPLPDSELPRRRHVPGAEAPVSRRAAIDRKSTRLNSSHLGISYAVFCL